ncbi:hypothetical protein APT09_22690, partial [Escherichia coli]
MEVFPFILRDVIFTCFEVFCSEMYIFWMDLFTFFCYWIFNEWNQNLTLLIARDTTFYIFTDLRSYISRGIIQVIFTTTPNSHKVKEGANKRGNTSRLTQSFHFFMFEPI